MGKDAKYIIDLCDDVLKVPGLREYRFDFLRGDSRDGLRRGMPLPVDAYYPELSLVIEYLEVQHDVSVRHFDKPSVITASGVHRGVQRAIYDQRRREVLPAHQIVLIEFKYSDFQCTMSKRLCRLPADDKDIVHRRLLGRKLGSLARLPKL